MQKQAPTLWRLTAMVIFVLACFGLLLFLWLSFGGAVPLKARGYRIHVAFSDAVQLADTADVRVAGVNVGTVVSERADPAGNRSLATIEIKPQYAPIHRDAQAILRAKTLLGETYVQLTFGTDHAPPIPDGGRLLNAQVQKTVAIDDVLGTFDPRTRAAFQTWQQSLAQALNQRGADVNSAIGQLPPFVTNANDVLQVLDVQGQALHQLIRNSAVVFNALSQRRSALHDLIVNSNRVFNTTAARSTELAQAFHTFPSFLDQSRLTQARLQSFSTDTDPLIRQLEPVATNLGPTLRSLRALSPDLKRLFINLNPLITVSQRGLPAFGQTLQATRPLLGQLAPFLEQLNPVLEYIGQYNALTSDFISQGGAALAPTTATPTPGSTGHYLRQIGPSGLESVAIWPNRLPTERGNTYRTPYFATQPESLLNRFLIPSSWDCNNTGAPGDGSVNYSENPSNSYPACWVAPSLPFQGRSTRFNYVQHDSYSARKR